jgi:hypothetical protein
MAMRGAVRLRKRAGKEFTRNLIGVLIAYVPIAAILTLAAGTPLGGVLIFGVIIVRVMAAILTVVVVWVGAGDEVSGAPDAGSTAGGSHGADGRDYWHGGFDGLA